MRNLTSNEISNVSGAGIFGDIGKQLGSAIGGIVDSMSGAINGHAPNQAATGAAGQLGQGIGNILDGDVLGAVNNMGQGIAGIVAAAKANKKPAASRA